MVPPMNEQEAAKGTNPYSDGRQIAGLIARMESLQQSIDRLDETIEKRVHELKTEQIAVLAKTIEKTNDRLDNLSKDVKDVIDARKEIRDKQVEQLWTAIRHLQEGAARRAGGISVLHGVLLAAGMAIGWLITWLTRGGVFPGK